MNDLIFLQLLERQKSAPTGTFHHTRRPWQVQQNQVLRIQVTYFFRELIYEFDYLPFQTLFISQNKEENLKHIYFFIFSRN